MIPNFKFKKFVFPNGLRLITFPMENTKALTILLLVATGSRYERKEINGISHLLEHMLFKGTKKRPNPLEICQQLDRVGGIYNAFTDKEYTGFWIKVEKSHLKLALDILSDIIFNSLFLEKEILKEKKVIFEEINMIKDNPQEYVRELLEELLYQGHPLGLPVIGKKSTLKKISRKHLLNYLKKQYTAQNIVITIAGKIEENEVKKEVWSFFKNLPKVLPSKKKPLKEKQKRPKVSLFFKKTDQTHLCLATRSFSLFDKRRYPLRVLSNLLGGIMSSRLFMEIREKRGISYYLYSCAHFYTDCGYLLTQCGVANQKTKEALKIILKEYQRLKEEKVHKEELEKAKENLKGKIYLALETSDAWANYLGLQELLKKKIFLPEKECAMIEKVNSQDLQKVARQIFQAKNFNLAIVGPFKEKKEFENLFK